MILNFYVDLNVWMMISSSKLYFIAYIIFEELILTAKKTQHLTITKIKWLTLFKEMTDVYSENHT